MLRQVQTAATEHERFMQRADEQMRAFERREAAFRREERAERAQQLHLPLALDDMH